MGYDLHSLARLPVDDDITMYIFVIDGEWKSGRFKVLQDNFPMATIFSWIYPQAAPDYLRPNGLPKLEDRAAG